MALDPRSREAVDLFNDALEAGKEGRHGDAADIFKRLALAGDTEAMDFLGYSLAKLGREDEAFQWLQQSARGGHLDAASQLATEAIQADDSSAARMWLTIGAEAGDTEDQALLAHLCIEARDYDCAKQWWTRLVADNSPAHQPLVEEARNNLAYLQEDPGYIAHILEQRLHRGTS